MEEILIEFDIFIQKAMIEASMGHKTGDKIEAGFLFKNKIEAEANRITDKYKDIYGIDIIEKQLQEIINHKIV